MARLSDEIRRSNMPIDRMASIQGSEILQSYSHGKYYLDEESGLNWMIEYEYPDRFLARLYRAGSDDVIVIERKKGVVRSQKFGQDQTHPIPLGASSPEFILLESKLRYPQLLLQPHLWRRVA